MPRNQTRSTAAPGQFGGRLRGLHRVRAGPLRQGARCGSARPYRGLPGTRAGAVADRTAGSA